MGGDKCRKAKGKYGLGVWSVANAAQMGWQLSQGGGVVIYPYWKRY